MPVLPLEACLASTSSLPVSQPVEWQKQTATRMKIVKVTFLLSHNSYRQTTAHSEALVFHTIGVEQLILTVFPVPVPETDKKNIFRRECEHNQVKYQTELREQK